MRLLTDIPGGAGVFPVEKGKKTGREEEENGLQLQRYSREPFD
ncbi:hypothetical protein [uncultured Butyricimonas sp.]|nr:hypothetical protein [uncultured Butyricimonas sp.]